MIQKFMIRENTNKYGFVDIFKTYLDNEELLCLSVYTTEEHKFIVESGAGINFEKMKSQIYNYLTRKR